MQHQIQFYCWGKKQISVQAAIKCEDNGSMEFGIYECFKQALGEQQPL